MHALDKNSLYDHVEFPAGIDLARRDISIQNLSELVRMALLSRYGGVWTDASVMCTRPLSEWLEEYSGSGFFAFRTPWKDRLISTWFIAAERDGVIIQRLYKNYSEFYANNRFSNQGTALGNLFYHRLQRRWNSDIRSTLKWHSWFTRKVLRVHPYFILNYMFNKLILEDPECAELWNDTPSFSAEPMHRLLFLERVSDGVEKAKREIDSGSIPMYKLNWRVDSSNSYWTIVLSYLYGSV